MEQKRVSIDSIKIGDRFRKELGDLTSLSKSISEVGLLHPIVINEEGTLIAGYRRLRACESLGWKEVPVTVISLKDIVRGEVDENRERKNFTISEIVDIDNYFTPILKQEHPAGRPTEKGGNIPQLTGEKTRDIVAKYVGVSGRTLEKIRKIVEKASPETIRKIDSGKLSVAHAYTAVQQKERHANPPPIPEGTFDVIYADPPWEYYHELRGAPTVHYNTMPLGDIEALKVPSAENAVLFLWATNPQLHNALHVMEAWGFTYLTNFCMDYRAKVRTPNGWVMIGKLVTQKYSGSVLSVDEHNSLVWRKVIGWHNNKLNGREIYHVSFQYSRLVSAPKGKRSVQHMGVRVTGDHKLLTESGWKRVDALTSDDMVCTGEYAPTPKQHDVIIGSLLGDGHISKWGQYVFGQTNHEYARLKHNILSSLGVSPLNETPPPNERCKTIHYGYLPETQTIRKLRQEWYPEGKMRLPATLPTLTNLLLAVWYLDDGSLIYKKYQNGYGRISTANFSINDVLRLIDWLKNAGLEANLRMNGKYPEIYIPAKSMPEFMSRVGPYIPETMRDKASRNTGSFNPHLWEDTTSQSLEFAKVNVVPSKLHQNSQNVFCIDVEETHNFVTHGGVMHNCWVKDKIGTGYWGREKHEILLVGKKGDFPPPSEDARCATVFEFPRGAHSSKPPEIRETIARMLPNRRYVELFARGSAPDRWTFWGEECE